MIWSIGDLHFDYTKDKAMDIFGVNWINHEDKIIDFWENNVSDNDLVLVPGDISWALKLEDGLVDLNRIDALPGMKCFVKGNHDYWWGTKAKLEQLNLKSIHFIYNDAFKYKNYIICGTRGWIPKDSEIFTDDDLKVFSRELNRLKLSLEYYKDRDEYDKIVIIHYPPFGYDRLPNEFLELMAEYKVKYCLYGHLHSEGHVYVVEGDFFDINVRCVSSDYLDFKLLNIE